MSTIISTYLKKRIRSKGVFDGVEVDLLGFCREGRKVWARLNMPALVFRSVS
jgi:hypothetical protein